MYFHFKKFSIRQRDSAMKVGTDGLLLATSSPLNEGEKAVLDIGTGTGLISLIIAQRDSQTKITAIELEKAAAQEAKFNFEASPYSNRIELSHSSLSEFINKCKEGQFDLIICNPPFFHGSQAEGKRKQARNSATLPMKDLLMGVSLLLTPSGQFSVIIPYQDEKAIIDTAANYLLFPFEILRIKGRKDSNIIRSVLHFKREKRQVNESEMHIEVELRHEYSKEYINLTKDFLTIFD